MVHPILYISDIYDHGYHTIKAVGIPGQYFEIYKFAFWPEKEVRRLNMSEMPTTGKFITKKSEEIDGNFLNARKSFTIGAYKLRIYGISAPHHGKLHIKFNKINHVVDTDSITQEFKLLFESEKIDFTTDSLDFVAIENKPVLIHCVYYLYDPPVQMEFNKIFTKKFARKQTNFH